VTIDRPPLEEALGRIVGGDEGRALREAATQRLGSMGIRRPEGYFLVSWPALARL
jgi:hypothetical protein